MPMPQFRKGSDQPLPEMPAPAPKPQGTTSTIKPNKYAGRCPNCGGWVKAKEGRLVKDADGKWTAGHIEPCPTPKAAEVVEEPEFVQTTVGGEVLYDGDYTLTEAPSGHEHRTFRLHTQAKDDEFMPGKQLIAYLSGPDNERDYTRFGVVLPDGTVKVWAKHSQKTEVIEDAEAFLANCHDGDKVVASVRCYRCGHKLTVPASVNNGLGPDCAKKGF